MRELPQGWAWTPLGAVCAPTSKIDPATLQREQFQYVDIGSIDGRRQMLSEVSVVDSEEAPSRARQLLRRGDTVFSTVRPYLRKIALIPEHLSGEIASTGFCVLRPTDAISSRFLYFTVVSDSFLDQVIKKQRGVSYPAVRPAEVLEIEVPLPPLAEQHRIVEVLEDHLSRLDAAERTLGSAEQRASLLSDVRLNDTVLGNSSEVRLHSRPNADLRGKYGRFDYQALPNLPGGWEWRLAESLCESINSGSTPSAERMQQDYGDVPFLKVYNIDPAGHVNFSKNPTFVSDDTHRGRLGRSIARPGDVVTNIVGPPLGKSAVIPDAYPEWNHNQAIVSFRAGPDIDPTWLAACLRSQFVVELLKGTARATAGQFNIALSTCRELPLPVPPLDAQRVLLAELSGQEAVLRRARSSIATAQARSIALRRALLRAAFKGELVDQDPNDQPADVALERLQADANT